MDGSIIKYKEDKEIGVFDAPHLFGDEALFYN